MNRNTLLIVDDVEVNRAILRSLFENEYHLLEAVNGEQALLLFDQHYDSLAAVLLDLVMPVMNGYQVLEEISIRKIDNNIPIMVITSEDSSDNEIRAFDLGVADIIVKPFEPHVIKRRIENIVELHRHKLYLEEMVEEQAGKMRDSQEALMDTLSSIIEHRSIETGQHVLRLRLLTKVLLEEVMKHHPEYGLTERNIRIMASAAALHDIGKISIPDAILNKPGQLTQEEFETMKTHSIKGCEILDGLSRMDDKEYLKYAYEICRHHHERWDGTGYPDGLKGDNIPICAQAAGVADCYDALTTDRAYKKALSPDVALHMILMGECGSFSPKLLQCMKNSEMKFRHMVTSYSDASKLIQAEKQLSQWTRKPGDTLEFSHAKYLAVLRYLNATVMEISWESDSCRLVYHANNDFELFQHRASFSKSIQRFAKKNVHEEDKKRFMHFLNSELVSFFEDGLMQRSQRVRIYHQSTLEYNWYEITLLRVAQHETKNRQILLVWRECESFSELKEIEEKPAFSSQNILVGIQQCRNDKWLTIENVNDDFLSLFGYSKQELTEQFQDRYLSLIYPDDRSHVLHQFNQQLKTGNQLELEYRCLTKENKTIWIVHKSQLLVEEDGREYFYSVLVDITQTKQAQEELRQTAQRHQIILDQTNEIVFEWDINQDHFTFSSNWNKTFGYDSLIENISLNLLIKSHLCPEDYPNLRKLKESIKKGDLYGETELRIAKADGNYLWCRIRSTTQFDQNGKPMKAVGLISNIDVEKTRTEQLKYEAERDSLTKLYNKKTAFQKIKSLLGSKEPKERSALLIIDVDNFKLVNDSRGHMYGDAVLVETAKHIKQMFDSDIVTRIGGDEFLVYIPQMESRRTLQRNASLLLETCRNIFADQLSDFPVSCSIGIAISPDDGLDFRDLFQHCDQALYQAKQRGKNQFQFYAPFMANTFDQNQDAYAVRTYIESDDVEIPDMDSLLLRKFSKLYESGNVDQALPSILEIVGKKYLVSRAYFCDANGTSTVFQSFEWCNEGISSQLDFWKGIHQAPLGKNYWDRFNESGVFYCPDISALPKEQFEGLKQQGIRSILQCAILDGEQYVGFVGFDHCSQAMMWSQNQINFLMMISTLFSSSLLKQREKKKTLESISNLQLVLDHQNSWIYVIDPDSYALKYLNHKIKTIAPGAKLGIPCYQAFFNQEAPCRECPAKNIGSKISQTAKGYHPMLKAWSDASFIRWGERDACLLCCYDVTQLEKNKA